MIEKTKLKNIEILAPAGSFETLHTAINAGCNSVYLGIADFNMRATAAANFKKEDLAEIVKIAHENDVKVYVTINTVLYNDELENMRQIVDLVKKYNVDAVIAADMATIQYAREKGVEVHISTQLSISNTATVKYYSQFSDRVVLARELSLEQVAEIVNDIKEQTITGPKGNLVEIEVFAHGALCVAVSGRCAMSLYCYGDKRSANRGKCTQVCRRKFKVVDEVTNKELTIDNNYVMSSSDLCTVGMLDKLVEAGVSVLKFEGRGRSSEYIDTVIRTYKEVLDAIAEDSYTPDKVKKWNETLKTVFNRGQTQNFYMGRKMDEWARGDGNKSEYKKIQVGIIENYFSKIGVAQIRITDDVELTVGDNYSITGPSTGIVKGTIKEIIIEKNSVARAVQGDVITIKIDDKVRKNDRIFKITKTN